MAGCCPECTEAGRWNVLERYGRKTSGCREHARAWTVPMLDVCSRGNQCIMEHILWCSGLQQSLADPQSFFPPLRKWHNNSGVVIFTHYYIVHVKKKLGLQPQGTFSKDPCPVGEQWEHCSVNHCVYLSPPRGLFDCNQVISGL